MRIALSSAYGHRLVLVTLLVTACNVMSSELRKSDNDATIGQSRKYSTTYTQVDPKPALWFWANFVGYVTTINGEGYTGQKEEYTGQKLQEKNITVSSIKRSKDASDDAPDESEELDSTPSKRAIHLSCYSCMSSEFQKYWPTLRTIYNQPRNFTDLCLDMPRRSRIGTQQCDSACLTVLERRYSGGSLVSGRPSGYNVIRGCLSTVYKSYLGYNPKLLSLRRRTASRRSMCEDMDARDLLPQSTKPTADNDRTGAGSRSSNPLFRASLCTCYGELCNNQPLSGVDKRRASIFLCACIIMFHQFVIRR